MDGTQCAFSPDNGGNTSEIKIDISAIPAEVWDDLSAATLNLIHEILQQPGGRAALDAKTAARKAAKA